MIKHKLKDADNADENTDQANDKGGKDDVEGEHTDDGDVEGERTDQGGEAGSADQVYKDQHSLHGSQLRQVRKKIMIQSYKYWPLDF